MKCRRCLTPIIWAVLTAGATAQPTSSTTAPAAMSASAPAASAAPPVAATPASSPAATTTSAPSPLPSPSTAVASAPAVTPASAPVADASTSAPAAPDNGLAIRNGDLIVFLGDELSETFEGHRANRPTFPQLVETFLTVRYPALALRYVSAGWSGDTAARARWRLERDVLKLHPTVVVVCLGMNDAGYLGFVPSRLEQTRKDLTQIVEQCRQAGARVWLMSPPCVEEDRGRKVRVTRDGQRAVADLQVIHYNQTLARYASAMREIAAAAPQTGFADWFAESSAARAHIQPYRGDDFLTIDGRVPSFRGMVLGAVVLLRALRADPIRVTIDLDWSEGTARISSQLGSNHAVPVQFTEDGKRILSVTGLPLPWPVSGGHGRTLHEGWETSEFCQILLRIPDPPESGVTLVEESPGVNNGGQCSITSAQLQAGFNLATAEPLRSLKAVRDLFNLVGTKNRTRETIWRRLELSPPQQAELTDAHNQLVTAWKAYVAGYERIIAGCPKTFDARFVLSEVVETENLPTSQPTRPPRLMHPSGNPVPATLPASANP